MDFPQPLEWLDWWRTLSFWKCPFPYIRTGHFHFEEYFILYLFSYLRNKEHFVYRPKRSTETTQNVFFLHFGSHFKILTLRPVRPRVCVTRKCLIKKTHTKWRPTELHDWFPVSPRIQSLAMSQKMCFSSLSPKWKFGKVCVSINFLYSVKNVKNEEGNDIN